MQGQHGQGQGGPNKSDVMEEDWRKQSERFSEQDRRNYVIMIAGLILTLCSFFHENKSYDIKKHLH
jgi:BioD-like phosphotransacetylase family protein